MYWLLNVLLALATVAVGFWVSNQDAIGRWRSNRPEITAVPLPSTRESRANPAIAPLGFHSAAEMDELWQRTLFRPERTDAQNAAAVGNEEPAAAQVPMEFVGMGRFDARAAAIIIVREPKGRQRPARPGAATPSGPRQPVDRRPKVYAVGEEVGSTGYLVKEIHFDNVLLVKGNLERVLTLDAGDDGTRVRTNREIRDRQARAVTARQDAAKPTPAATTKPAVAATDPGAPPPPPPPPPLVVPTAAPGRAGGAALTAEERIARARAIRERLLERQKKKNTPD